MNQKSQNNLIFDRNSPHFRVLGLTKGECRIDVIRSAAVVRAKAQANRSHPRTVDSHRAKVALATYKLLDPRNRSALYERVQLSCPLNEDEIHQPVRESLSNLNRATGIEKPPTSLPTPVLLIMEKEVLEQAIVEETVTEVEQETDLSLAEKRHLVRLLRENEANESLSRSMSPISWLRSYLRI